MPDDNARRGIIDGRPVPCTRRFPPTSRRCSRTPTGAPWAAARPSTSSRATQPTDEHFFQLRVDHRLSAERQLFARITYDLGDVVAFRPTSRPSRSSTRTRATPTSPLEHSTRSRRRSSTCSESGSTDRCRSRTTAHHRHPGLDVLDSRRAVRLPDGPGHGHRNGGRLPPAARRQAQQLADGEHADPDPRPPFRALRRAGAIPAVRPAHHEPGGRHRQFRQPRELPARPRHSVDFAVPGQDRSGSPVSPVAVRRRSSRTTSAWARGCPPTSACATSS